jgi:hypothetical protein
MAGILVPLCEYWLETLWIALAWVGFFLAYPSFGTVIAMVFGAWDKYQKKYIPPIAVHPWIFWIVWALIYAVTGIIAFMTYFYSGRFCEQFILLSLLMLTIVPYIVWPLTLFVADSFLITLLVMIFLFIWFVVLLILNFILNGENLVVLIILYVLILLWVLYNILWLFVAWRCKSYAFPNIRGVLGNLKDKAGGLFACPDGSSAIYGRRKKHVNCIDPEVSLNMF